MELVNFSLKPGVVLHVSKQQALVAYPTSSKMTWQTATPTYYATRRAPCCRISPQSKAPRQREDPQAVLPNSFQVKPPPIAQKGVLPRLVRRKFSAVGAMVNRACAAFLPRSLHRRSPKWSTSEA